MQTELHLQVNNMDGKPTEEVKRIVVVQHFDNWAIKAIDLTHIHKKGLPWIEGDISGDKGSMLIFNSIGIPFSERIQNTIDERFNAYVVKGGTVAFLLDRLTRGDWLLNDCTPELTAIWKAGKRFSNPKNARA